MTRSKVKLAFIVNDAARKSTYKKRKKSLLKKVHELTTLCGIEACAIIYSPYDPQPEVWPTPLGVQRVLSKFKTVPEFDKSKKMVNQETFLKQRILKVKEQLNKQRRDNREKELIIHMFDCLKAGKIVSSNLLAVDLNNLARMIDLNLKDIRRRLDEGLSNNNNSQVQPEMAPMPPPATSQNEEMEVNNAYIMQGQFFMDIARNGHGDEGMLFGNDADLQNEFWTNLQP